MMEHARHRRPRHKLRLFLAGLGVFVLLVAAAIAVVVSWRGDDGSTYLSDIVAGMLSRDGNKVEIGSVEGALTSNIVVRNLTVADRDGIWLRLDRAELVWNRAALLSGRLSVDNIDLGRLDIARAPIIERPAPEPENADSGGLLPELPVAVVVKRFRLDQASLGEPLLGIAARLTMDGTAKLGDPFEGLQLELMLRRLDSAGQAGISLSYVPETQALDVRLEHTEPAGGLAARLMKIDGLPPVAFIVQGQGVLDDFKATMRYSAGPALGADGTATLLRSGTARVLSLDARARIEALLPQPLSMLVAGDTNIAGRASFDDDRSITIGGLDIASKLARFNLSGRVTPDRTLDLTLTANAVEGQDGRTRTGDSEVGKFDLHAAVKGAVAAPEIAAKLDIADLHTPQGSLQSGQATLAAAPRSQADGRVSALKLPWDLRADVTLDGFSPAQRQWSEAIGPSLKLALQATRQQNGAFDVKVLNADTPTVSTSYTGTVSARGADGVLKMAAPDLAAFSALAGRQLRGSLQATSRLSGTVDDGGLVVDTDAKGRGLSFGHPAADGLVQGAAVLKGRTQVRKDGISFDGVRFDAGHLKATLDGGVADDKADARLKLDIDDLASADARLKGRLAASVVISGTSAHPDVKVSAMTDQATVIDQPIGKLALEVVAKDVLEAPDATLDLQGDIGDKPLVGRAHLQRSAVDRWKLAGVDFRFGGASLAGGLSADAGLFSGQFKVVADRLDELSALALTKLSGSFDGELTLDSSNGRQDGRLIARGRDIVADTVAVKALDADLTGSDLYSKPVLHGSLTGAGWQAAGQSVDAVSVQAQGDGSASKITVRARGEGLSADTDIVIVPADSLKITLAGLAVKRAQKSVSLVKPVTLTLDDNVLTIPGLAIASNGGQAAISGKLGIGAGVDSDLNLAFRKLPLAIAALAAPNLDFAGTLDGTVDVTGPVARPKGQYELTFSNVTAPQTRQAGLPPVNATVKGQLQGVRTAFDAVINIGRAGQFTVAGTAPFDPNEGLSATVRGQLDAAAANSALSASGQQLTGRVIVDASVSGRMQRPSVTGRATISNASFTDPLQGVRLSNINGLVTGRGDTVVIERLTAQTRNAGSINLSGQIEVAPDQGFPGSLRIVSNRAELVSNQLVTAVSSMDMTLTGPLAQTPKVAGKVDIVSMDVSVPNRLPATVQPLPNARHIAPPPQVRKQLEAERKARQKAQRATPFDASLDITVSAPNRVFIRGQGIDAEVGGDLRITGSSRQPNVIGGFDMRRGHLSIVGQRLDFTRGKLGFTGEMMPELDFLAQTRAAEVTATVAVTGPANQPSFTLSSNPELPQDEILSRLLFAKASGSLSPFQALQLAQAVAQLSGASNVDVFDETRKALGLDSLDITSGSSGGPAVGASRYINDRISVGVRAGAKPEDNAASVNIDINKRLKVQGEVGATGNTSIGIGAEWEY